MFVLAYALSGTRDVYQYDGASWTKLPSSHVDNLSVVWAADAENLFVGGQGGTILHYDGKG